MGQLNDPHMLAGVGLANMTMAFTGYMFLMGLNSCIETFVSQAAGSGKIELCGIYLNRARFLFTLFFIPLALILLQIEKVLLFLGQDPGVSKYA